MWKALATTMLAGTLLAFGALTSTGCAPREPVRTEPPFVATLPKRQNNGELVLKYRPDGTVCIQEFELEDYVFTNKRTTIVHSFIVKYTNPANGKVTVKVFTLNEAVIDGFGSGKLIAKCYWNKDVDHK